MHEVKTIELNRERDKTTTAAGDFKTLLSANDRTTIQKVSKNVEELNNKIN